MTDPTSTSDSLQEIQSSPHDNLMAMIRERSPRCSHHHFSDAALPARWRETWSRRICLIWLKPETANWQAIVRWFEERGIRKSYHALYTEWSRASAEVNYMRTAARAYEQFRLNNWINGLDCSGPWEYMLASMRVFGCAEAWTAAKIEYIWHFLLAELAPGILSSCTPTSSLDAAASPIGVPGVENEEN